MSISPRARSGARRAAAGSPPRSGRMGDGGVLPGRGTVGPRPGVRSCGGGNKRSSRPARGWRAARPAHSARWGDSLSDRHPVPSRRRAAMAKWRRYGGAELDGGGEHGRPGLADRSPFGLCSWPRVRAAWPWARRLRSPGWCRGFPSARSPACRGSGRPAAAAVPVTRAGGSLGRAVRPVTRVSMPRLCPMFPDAACGRVGRCAGAGCGRRAGPPCRSAW